MRGPSHVFRTDTWRLPPEDFAELLERLGNIPPENHPPAAAAGDRHRGRRPRRPRGARKRLCELIDGVLVEKPMGYTESVLATYLIVLLDSFVRPRNLGADHVTRWHDPPTGRAGSASPTLHSSPGTKCPAAAAPGSPSPRWPPTWRSKYSARATRGPRCSSSGRITSRSGCRSSGRSIPSAAPSPSTPPPKGAPCWPRPTHWAGGAVLAGFAALPAAGVLRRTGPTGVIGGPPRLLSSDRFQHQAGVAAAEAERVGHGHADRVRPGLVGRRGRGRTRGRGRRG